MYSRPQSCSGSTVLCLITLFFPGHVTSLSTSENVTPCASDINDYCSSTETSTTTTAAATTTATTGLSFRDPTAPPANFSVVCVNQAVELHCCVVGYKSLIWEQHYRGRWREIHNLTMEKRRLLENNQTLLLESVVKDRDGGPFRCIASTQTAHISQEVKLDIRDCMHWNETPELLKPPESQRFVEAQEGRDISIECVAFFGSGCKSDKDYHISWSIALPGVISDTSNVTENRIYFTTNNGLYGNALTSELHISDVKKSDFNLVFQCLAKNSVGAVTHNITLSRAHVPGFLDRPDLKIALAVVGSVVASAVLILTVLWKFRLDVRLWFKEHSSRLQDKGDATYDVVLLSPIYPEPADMCMYEYLHDTLEDYGYRVFSQRDVAFGKRAWDEFCAAAKRSRCVAVVLTTPLVEDEDNMCGCLSELSVSTRRLVFIKYKLNSALLDGKLLTGVKERLRVSNRVTWPDDVVVNKVDEKLQAMCHSNHDRRAVDNFWKRLRLALPPLPKDRRGRAVPRQQGRDRLPRRTEVTPPPRDSTSSQQPLMNSVEDDERDKRVHNHAPDEQRVELVGLDVEAALINSC